MQAAPRAQEYLSPATDPQNRVPFVPFTTMVNFFLETIVQPNRLTDLERHLGRDFTNLTDLEESRKTEKSQWETYVLGFILFLSIGILVTAVLLVLGPVVTFCLIKGVGPFRSVLTLRPSTISASTWLILGLVVVVLAILMLLVIVPMFAMSIWVRQHTESTVFVKFIDAIEALDAFIARTADELQAKSIATLQLAKNMAFAILDATPQRVALAFDSKTGNQTSKNVKRLHELGTQKLPKLRGNLEEAMSMIGASKTNESDGTAERQSSQSSAAQRPDIAEKLGTLLNVVKMATTNDSKTIPGSKPLARQLSDGDAQLQAMKSNMAKTVNDPVAEVKRAINETEATIKEFADTAAAITLISLINELRTLHDDVTPTINGVFAFLVIIFLILLAITLLHVTAFFLYFPYWMPTYKFAERNRTIQAGTTLFRVVVYMILLTAWLYWVVAAVTMFFAGLAHTEVCRHLTDPHGLESKRVILILDAYLTSMSFAGSSRNSFSILETYSQCEKDLPIYKAANVQRRWNFEGMFDLTELRKATNQLQNVNVNVQQASLLSSDLKAMMLRLEELHKKIDIAGMSQKLHASTLPDAFITNKATNSSHMPIASQPEVQELKVRLAKKLDQIANDMASYGLANLSSGLEENQNTFRTKGEEITRSVTRNISTEVYDIFAEAVHQIELDVKQNIGHCRRLYVALKPAVEEACIQILYPINGFWFCLGMASLILIPIFIVSCKLSDFLETFQCQNNPPSPKTTTENLPDKVAKENQQPNQPPANPNEMKNKRISPQNPKLEDIK